MSQHPDPVTLLADVGGTRTRISQSHAPDQVTCYQNSRYGRLEDIINDYLQQQALTQAKALIAIACPVTQQHISMTNLAWSFSIDEFLENTGLQETCFINDFVAQAYAVPALEPHELIALNDCATNNNQTKLIAGPGTGLGVAGLLPTQQGWQAIPSEGGHCTLAATTEQEEQLLRTLRHQFSHVSAERLLSGPGIELLYKTLCQIHQQPPLFYRAEDITRQATLAQDELCKTTMDTYFRFLGNFAGSLALILGAQGGIYWTGGILPELESLFRNSDYQKCFCNKGRYREYLSNIPQYLIIRKNPAMLGLAYLAEHQNHAPGASISARQPTPR